MLFFYLEGKQGHYAATASFIEK